MFEVSVFTVRDESTTDPLKGQLSEYRSDHLVDVSAERASQYIKATFPGADVILDELQRQPLVFETEITIHLGVVARKKAESRQPVTDIHPNFGPLCRDVLCLRAQGMRGPELKEAG